MYRKIIRRNLTGFYNIGELTVEYILFKMTKVDNVSTKNPPQITDYYKLHTQHGTRIFSITVDQLCLFLS